MGPLLPLRPGTNHPAANGASHRTKGANDVQEHWKPIADYDDYEVSSLGNVRRAVSSNYPAGRYLKQEVLSNGYRRVTLSNDGKARRFLVHRVVAYAFHGGPQEASHHASHLNGQRGDNRAANLAWKSPSDNNMDKRLHGTAQCGERGGRAIMTEADIAEITKLRARQFGQKNWGATLIARELGLPQRAVKHVISGTSWTHVTGGAL